MTERRSQAVVVGISGPDGSGKTTAARRAAEILEEKGFSVLVIHTYGCVFCRRVQAGGDTPRRLWPRRRSGLHAAIDAGELWLRVQAAKFRVRRTAQARHAPGQAGTSGTAVVLTDRSPIDGLVKFGRPPGTWASDVYLCLGRRYRRIVVLNVSSEQVLGRSEELSASALADNYSSFTAWSGRFANVTILDVFDEPVEVVAREVIRAAGLESASSGL